MSAIRTSAATLAIAVLLGLVAATPARAVSLHRDADIEHGLRQLAAPVLQAAGLSPDRIGILVVDATRLNAFAGDARHILVTSGLILTLDTARSLRAVIALEAAHLANGRFTRRAANLRSARGAAGLGIALAATAAVASSPGAAVGIGAGTSSAALRGFLAHTRGEGAADDASAIRYIARAGIDPAAAVEVLAAFRGQEVLSVGRQDPYMRTHPLSRDRLRAAEGAVAAHARRVPQDPTDAYWFARAQGKLSAFTRTPGWTLRRADASPSRDIALMRQAAAHHLNSDVRRAVAAIDGARTLRPSDPFLGELKGQILLKSRQADAAIAVSRRVADPAPGEALILGGLGRAHLAAGDAGAALPALERARDRDGQDARVLRDLAVAYARTGQTGMASLATAERYALQGRMTDAGPAARAVALLPRGSTGGRRAEDRSIAARAAAR